MARLGGHRPYEVRERPGRCRMSPSAPSRAARPHRHEQTAGRRAEECEVLAAGAAVRPDFAGIVGA